MKRGKRIQYLTRYRVTGFTCHRDMHTARCEKKSIGGESSNIDSNIYLLSLCTNFGVVQL